MTRKKVCLIRVDGKKPNLALMKISSFYKKKGYQVDLIDLSNQEYENIFASKIFVGGSGYDVNAELPKDIELIKPDYDLFKKNYSVGFTTRGCIRNCGFCLVREKEGLTHNVDVDLNFIDDRFKNVMILDPNFLSGKNHIDILKKMIYKKYKVNFNQGLDLRLINDQNGYLISKVKYYNDGFKRRLIHFAWDNVLDEDKIFRGLDILDQYIPRSHIILYVLVGFDTDFKEDMYRVNKLIVLGYKPYVMIFNKDKFTDPKLKKLQRWINRGYYRFIKWKDFENNKLKL